MLVESSQGTPTLPALTAAHAHTRPTRREATPSGSWRSESASADSISSQKRRARAAGARPGAARGAERGLVCLSGCARTARRARPERSRRARPAFGPSASTSSCSGLRAWRRQDGTRSCATSPSTRASRTSSPATSTRTTRAEPRSRTSSSRSAATPRSSRRARARGNRESILRAPVELLEIFPDDRDAVLRTAEVAARLEFDLTEELGCRYPDFSDGDVPAIRQLARVCEDAFAERYPPSNRLLLSRARARLGAELGLIDQLGLAGFFLLHWEVLELARELANGIRGPARPAAGFRPGGAGLVGRLDRLLPDRPLARRPGRAEPLARPLPQP